MGDELKKRDMSGMGMTQRFYVECEVLIMRVHGECRKIGIQRASAKARVSE